MEKIYKITMWVITILGIIGTIAATIFTAGIFIFMKGSFELFLPEERNLNYMNFFAITNAIIIFVIGAATTFLATLGMGFTIEIVEDIEQIKINTTPHISRKAE